MSWKALVPAGVVWAAVAGPAAAGDLPKSVLATPLPPGPGVLVPDGGPLAAPVITPLGVTRHGHQLFDVIPAGWDKHGHKTTDPGRRLYEQVCSTPADECCGWVDLEFLFWATRGVSPPPLLTTGPAAAAPGVAGALGQPTTAVLFGGGRTLDEFRPGFRVEAGLWRDEHAEEAAFVRFFMIGSESDGRSAGAYGQTVLAVPQGVPGGTLPVYAGYPGVSRGVAEASTQTDFYGADGNLTGCLCDRGWGRLDLLGGFRYVYLGDRLDRQFATTATPIDAAGPLVPGVGGPFVPPAGSQLFEEDSVRTRNNFYGGQLGLGFGHRYGQLSGQVRGLVALGATVSHLDTSSTRTAAGVPGVVGGAMSSSNTSTYFAAVPEVGVRFGWQPCSHVRFTAGYDWLYWSRVRRAADAYSLGPTIRNNGTDVWAQGFSGGIEIRY